LPYKSNTANQNRLKQQQIDNILIKIQGEILQDLQSGDRLINWYNLSDSFSIRAKGKDLYARGESGVKYGPLQYLGPDKPWFNLPVSSIILRFDYQGANTISILQGIQERTLFTKIND
jgi:hypothetical protein